MPRMPSPGPKKPRRPKASASRPPAAARAPEPGGPPARDRILAAALAAFADHGFLGASTREIAAAAGVPQGLVTYHFESKQRLWESAVDWIFDAVRADLEQAIETLQDVDPVTRLRAVLKRFARLVGRHPELHRFMTQEGGHDGPRLRWLVDRHVRPLFLRSTALIADALPGVDAAHFHYVLIGAIGHVFAVAPEYARVTGRAARTPEAIEAHATRTVDALIDGSLASGAAGGTPERAAARKRTGRKA